uniref:Uncharacterized protein n=1 Tax=Sphaerodactylus townsendi TaxID=933632 RepID=A0ACB8EZ45_9SAUR
MARGLTPILSKGLSAAEVTSAVLVPTAKEEPSLWKMAPPPPRYVNLLEQQEAKEAGADDILDIPKCELSEV